MKLKLALPVLAAALVGATGCFSSSIKWPDGPPAHVLGPISLDDEAEGDYETLNDGKPVEGVGGVTVLSNVPVLLSDSAFLAQAFAAARIKARSSLYDKEKDGFEVRFVNSSATMELWPQILDFNQNGMPWKKVLKVTFSGVPVLCRKTSEDSGTSAHDDIRKLLDAVSPNDESKEPTP